MRSKEGIGIGGRVLEMKARLGDKDTGFEQPALA